MSRRTLAVFALSVGLYLSPAAHAEDSPAATVSAQLAQQVLVTPPAAPPAVQAPPAMDSPEAALVLAVQAASSGQWLAVVLALLAGALGVFATVAGARRYLARLSPWLDTPRGGVALSLGAGALGSLAAAVASGVPLSLSLVLGVLSSFLAAGVRTTAKKAMINGSCSAEDVENGKPGCR